MKSKKALVVNNNFYNDFELEEFKEYVSGTCKKLAEIYDKLGGLENNSLIESGVLTEEDMSDIFTFSDILSGCEILEVKR